MPALDDLETPALVLRIAAVRRNIQRLADETRGSRIAVRPHAKTHKSPWIAQQQVSAGAVGICVSHLHEADTLAKAGVRDILITSELPSGAIGRLLQTAEIAALGVVADDEDFIRSLGAAARARGLCIRVVIDVNVGQARCGLDDPADVARLADLAASTQGTSFGGIQGYEGHLQHVHGAGERRQLADIAYGRLARARAEVEKHGLRIGTVTAAGTGTYRFAMEHGVVTEIQPGSYVVMDGEYGEVEGLAFEEALFVFGRVVSRTRPKEVIVDIGWKAVSTEKGPPRVVGHQATYRPAGDEHGRISGDVTGLRLGDIVRLLPSHCDTTVDLHSRYVLLSDEDEPVGILPVAARGHSPG